MPYMIPLGVKKASPTGYLPPPIPLSGIFLFLSPQTLAFFLSVGGLFFPGGDSSVDNTPDPPKRSISLGRESLRCRVFMQGFLEFLRCPPLGFFRYLFLRTLDFSLLPLVF